MFEILIYTLKENNPMQTVEHPFKRPVIIFVCFRGKKTVKTEHKFKNNNKYDTNDLTNSFVKNYNMYF